MKWAIAVGLVVIGGGVGVVLWLKRAIGYAVAPPVEGSTFHRDE